MLLIIYTHTDFNDIFQIQKDHIKNIDKSESEIMIFSNDNIPLYSPYKVIKYNDSLTYPQRVLSCLIKLKITYNFKDKFILFCPDNNIILSYEEDKIKDIINAMEINNLDRISLCNKLSIQSNIYTDKYKIKLVEADLLEKYSVGPSIYSIDSFIDIMSQNMHCNYRNLEHTASEYLNKIKAKCYHVSVNRYTEYFGRKLPRFFEALHITHFGNFIITKSNPYYDYTKYLYDKYKNKRNVI